MTMTLDEFVAWEQTQDGRHELEDGQIIALPGGNEAHSAIRANLLTAAGAKLRGSGCHTLASSMLVRTGSGNLRRPDLTIDCWLHRADALVAPNPTVVFEVLSADSEIRDRTRKLGDYISHQRYPYVISKSTI
jgi:Uma2 family endonuclease